MNSNSPLSPYSSPTNILSPVNISRWLPPCQLPSKGPRICAAIVLWAIMTKRKTTNPKKTFRFMFIPEITYTGKFADIAFSAAP
jgi:hypothetical protein